MAIGPRGSMGDYSAPPPQPPSPNPKATLIVSILGVATAVLTVLSAYLGFETASATKEKESAQQAAASSGATASDLQNQVSQLQKENSQLRSQLPQPTAAVASGPAPSVRHKGQITLRDGYFDLDSPQSDPQWNTGSGDIFKFGSTAIASYGSAQVLGLDSTPASHDSCMNNTGYTNQVNDLSAGLYVCVKTDQGRYSALKVTKISSDAITVDVVTYDPPTS